MKRVFVNLLVLALVSGCAGLSLKPKPPAQTGTGSGQIRPVARPAGLNATVTAVATNARTVEDFDTSTTEQRKAAEADSAAPETDLGLTIVSLGSASEPGFWLKTPLVSRAAKGRVVFAKNGASVLVGLIAIDGPKTAGSRLSLAALRVIEAPLAGLSEVRVYRLSE